MDWFLAIRFHNTLIIIVAQILLAISASTHPLNYKYLPLSIVVILYTACIASAGYLQNNYLDHELDTQCKKRSNLWISNRMGQMNRWIYTMYIIGALLVLYVHISINHWAMTVASMATIAMLIVYNHWLKKVPLIGNLFVAIMCGLSIIVVYMVFPTYREFSVILTNPLILLITFFTLIREMVKDLEDLECDRQYGYRTLPIVLGARLTVHWIAMLSMIFLVYLMYQNFRLPIVVLISLNLIVVNALLYREQYHKASIGLKMMFILGVCYLMYQVMNA